MTSAESFNELPQDPQQCEFGYDADKANCIVTLPDGTILELIQTTVTEPDKRHSLITGFSPSKNAMGEVYLIEEFGKLSVKKVSIDGEVFYQTPTIH